MEKICMNDFAWRVLSARNGMTHLFSVGQAGYILKSKQGQLLGIDLYLSECLERTEGHVGFKRLLPRILGLTDLQFDCIVATHPHYDHFDFDAMPELMANRQTHLYASVNCRQEITRLKMSEENIIYVKAGDTYQNGDYILDFVFCDHGTGAPDAVGLIITVDERKIYIAGDTCLRLDKANEYIEKGPFDIMIAPINGAYGNLTEKDCTLLSATLKPRLTIPSHYGMFASHGGDPGVFMKYMRENCPENRYYLMTLGEEIIL